MGKPKKEKKVRPFEWELDEGRADFLANHLLSYAHANADRWPILCRMLAELGQDLRHELNLYQNRKPRKPIKHAKDIPCPPPVTIAKSNSRRSSNTSSTSVTRKAKRPKKSGKARK